MQVLLKFFLQYIHHIQHLLLIEELLVDYILLKNVEFFYQFLDKTHNMQFHNHQNRDNLSLNHHFHIV